MNVTSSPATAHHSHVFLGAGHRQNERSTWLVIWLCAGMMVLEIGGGAWFGSIALVADGLHMSTHAGAMLLAALAYTFARKHAQDERFSFGTGKLGDLAGFTSAIILAVISLLIGYEAISRLFVPITIHFAEAIPIALLGLCVNIATAWLLSGGGSDHSHGHSHGHGHKHHGQSAEIQKIQTSAGVLELEIFEDNVPPCFRVYAQSGPLPSDITIETLRPDGARQIFSLAFSGAFLESEQNIPEPHTFTAILNLSGASYELPFVEHEHIAARAGRDNNMRAALVHIIADAAVSVLVIAGLTLAKFFGWLWMDPLAGIIGAFVIASWALGLIKDTSAILLDMNPDRSLSEKLRQIVEAEGDKLTDLHLWRLGPGHLGAIICVGTNKSRGTEFYRAKLAKFRSLSHLTVEVQSL